MYIVYFLLVYKDDVKHSNSQLLLTVYYSANE